MKIHITGVSGTGKTSLTKVLQEKGINAVDLDTISHWENKATKEIVGWEPGLGDAWMDAHAWICDISRLKEILNQAEHSVALGHTSNHEEYLPLFDKVFVLQCSPETITQRIMQRTDNDFGKHPDDLARILNWNKMFTAWMVDEKGAQVIDAEKPLDQVAGEITSHFAA